MKMKFHMQRSVMIAPTVIGKKPIMRSGCSLHEAVAPGNCSHRGKPTVQSQTKRVAKITDLTAAHSLSDISASRS
jgi:hypothetical protein